MFAEERRQQILQHLRVAGKVTVDELSARFGVSAPTIRADLSFLEKQGLLRRTHGGALPVESTLYEPPYSVREMKNLPEKRAIARVAATLVQDEETVLLDAGTTTFEIALQLKQRRGLKVVTNSLAIALEMMERKDMEVVLLGGSVHPARRATLGELVLHALDVIYVDHAFLSFNGVDARAGYTSVDFEAAAVKRKMMQHARQVVVVADHAKLGQVAFARVAPAHSAHVLVVDDGAPAEMLKAFEEQGVRVLTAPII
ncbi:MAG: DeoR/GlpR transcriptional regulator [Chthonomonadetes bacterium]|nr:DeoR/GlpR transcriptional regulator [Chthonomonadetes bacterium]